MQNNLFLDDEKTNLHRTQVYLYYDLLIRFQEVAFQHFLRFPVF